MVVSPEVRKKLGIAGKADIPPLYTFYMRASHRNRAVIQYVIALGLTALVIYMFVQGLPKLRTEQLGEGWMILWLFLYLGTVTLWMVASFSLAKAKGHRSDKIGCIFGFCFVVGVFIPIAPFIFPAYVIFALEDLEKRRRW